MTKNDIKLVILTVVGAFFSAILISLLPTIKEFFYGSWERVVMVIEFIFILIFVPIVITCRKFIFMPKIILTSELEEDYEIDEN